MTQDKQIFDAEQYEKQSYINVRQVLKAKNAFDLPTLGLNRSISTLTQVIQDVLYTKYYTVPQPLTDYVKIDASGVGAYSKDVIQFTAGNASASFKECVINPASTGFHNDPTADTVVGEIRQRNNFYRQTYSISHEEMEMAGRNLVPFNIIEAKERSRVTNWQLGIQDTMFIGLQDGSSTYGLLNQPNATVNTEVLPVPIQKMTPAQLNTFVGTVLNAYGSVNNYNYMPNRLYLPTPMYLALGQQVNPEFPLKNLRQTLEDAFNANTGVNDFKIVHAAYGTDLGTKGLGRAVLYNTQEDNVVMHTPLVYTPMPLFPQGPLDMESQAMGQFTGVWLKRPTTMVYLDVQAAENQAAA